MNLEADIEDEADGAAQTVPIDLMKIWEWNIVTGEPILPDPSQGKSSHSKLCRTKYH